jgi:hypothetical protein
VYPDLSRRPAWPWVKAGGLVGASLLVRADREALAQEAKGGQDASAHGIRRHRQAWILAEVEGGEVHLRYQA